MAGLSDIGNQYSAQRAYQQTHNNLQNALNQLRSQYPGIGAAARQGFLGTVPGANTPFKALPVDPATRIAEIDHELDIIRGIVPTPEGYIINPSKVKQLMNERKELIKR